MKNLLYFLIFLSFVIAGCTDNDTAKRDEIEGFNVTKIADQVMRMASNDSDKAMQFIDSLQNAGFPDYEADLFRAKIYSQSLDDMKYDTTIIIGERLIQLDVAKENP